jgi:hypothetical protein
MHTALNVQQFAKGEDKYIWIFDDRNRDATLRQIARDAANPELSLTWYDAAVLSKKVRETPITQEEDNGNHHHISPYCLKPHNRRCTG